jgi:glycosyltransferase 2 family protein
LIAVFIFSISTVVGALIATPGGLGGTEGALVALTAQLLGLARTPASAAALLIRFATLWFGVILGLICLALWPHLLGGGESGEQVAENG